MKKHFRKIGVILLAAVLVCSGCKQKPAAQDKTTNSKGQTGTVEVGGFDAVKLKDQIIATVQEAPKLRDLARFFKETGSSYMMELTLPIKDVEKYMTRLDQSLAAGIYVFDLAYARVYNREDVVLQLLDVVNELADKLNLADVQSVMLQYHDRIKQNSENSDSLNIIVMNLMNEIATGKTFLDNTGFTAMFYVTSNIQGLYVLTQAATMATNNAAMITFIGAQKERIKVMYQLLELTAIDPLVAPIFEKMKPIMNYFTDNQVFSAKQLAEVTPMIEQLRKEIVK
jgi:hypothetical protein